MIHKNQLIAQVTNAIREEETKLWRKTVKEEQMFILREMLQLYLLEDLYSKTKSFENVFFMWGTNLRLCYGLPRYSEDLDFTVLDTNSIPNQAEVTTSIKNLISGYDIESVRWKTNVNIMKTNILFPGLPFECWITNAHTTEKIDIKFEIDTMPAKWGKHENTLIFILGNPVRIKHHTLETTFAGKLSAILMRIYSKGRDYFDIDWYLRRKPSTPFSLEYVNGNIRRYNEMNTYNENFEPLLEFADHKSVLEAVGNKFLSLTKNEKDRIEQDIKRFVFWRKDQTSDYLETLYPRITSWLVDYYQAIQLKLEETENQWPAKKSFTL